MKFKMPSSVNRYGPVLVWMVVIFAFSSYSTLPGSEIVWWDYIIKKSAHMFEYAILLFLMARALNWQKPVKNWSFTTAFVVTLLYALSDEIHQSFTPGRHPKLTDVGYDSLGAFLMYARLRKFI